MAGENFIRTEMLFGKEAMERLAQSRVAVFGIGGVGGYAVEALVRSGIGALDLIDGDCVAESNLNRQIIATYDTIGMKKVDAAAARAKSIHPGLSLRTYPVFYTAETADAFDFSQYDYVIDAIDMVTSKIALVLQAQACGVPIISSMGAGNKVDPARFSVTDIYKTSVCPLAKVMRQELKKRHVKKLKVVYSTELPLTPAADPLEETPARRQTPGSNAFVPSVAGLILAGEVIRDLTGVSPRKS